MKIFSRILSLIVVGFLGILTVVILFFMSEKEMHRNNAFIRRYPHHPLNIRDTINIKYDSYYFAGIENDTIYLGNTTAPLFVLKVSLTNKDTSHVLLNVPDFKNYQYVNPRVQFRNSKYYLYDGSVPVIFSGSFDSKLKNALNQKIYFDRLQIIDSNRFWIRSRLTQSNQLELGLLDIKNQRVTFHKKLLTRQIDGFFDVDGIMSFSNNSLLYIYFYRNNYQIINNQGDFEIGNTIDTLSQSNIKIAYNKKRGRRKLANQPTLVNLKGTTWEKYLFINSDRLGKYEPAEMLREASIIDVYDFKEKSYEFSFYLYDHFDKKAREFRVVKSRLYALYDNYLTIHHLDLPD